MRITLFVKPNSKKEQITRISEVEYRVSVNAPPHEGRANEAVILLLSKHFKIPKSSIRIVSGLKGKKKILEMDV